MCFLCWPTQDCGFYCAYLLPCNPKIKLVHTEEAVRALPPSWLLLLVILNWYEAKENRASSTSSVMVALEAPNGSEHAFITGAKCSYFGAVLLFKFKFKPQAPVEALWGRLQTRQFFRRTRGTTALRWQRTPSSQKCSNKKMINHLENNVLLRNKNKPEVRCKFNTDVFSVTLLVSLVQDGTVLNICYGPINTLTGKPKEMIYRQINYCTQTTLYWFLNIYLFT